MCRVISQSTGIADSSRTHRPHPGARCREEEGVGAYQLCLLSTHRANTIPVFTGGFENIQVLLLAAD